MMSKHRYSDWENFKAMFIGLSKELKITAVLLGITVPPIFLMLWIIDLVVSQFR